LDRKVYNEKKTKDIVTISFSILIFLIFFGFGMTLYKKHVRNKTYAKVDEYMQFEIMRDCLGREGIALGSFEYCKKYKWKKYLEYREWLVDKWIEADL